MASKLRLCHGRSSGLRSRIAVPTRSAAYRLKCSASSLLTALGRESNIDRVIDPCAAALLERAGLEVLEVQSWGNRGCVVGSFELWPAYRRCQSLVTEPDPPVLVWAFAERRGHAGCRRAGACARR